MSDTTNTSEPTIANLLHEHRAFAPSAEFAAQANVTADAYAAADVDRLAFWDTQAERLDWAQHWDQTLDWSNPPFAKWFVGGKLNAAYNCLDRHVANGLGDRVAYYFEGDRGDTRTITYQQLTDQVCQAANALVSLGVKTGDRVAIYMPMIPETVVAMLACARLGAPHTVVFGGFSAEALRSRIEDCQARVVITADGAFRKGNPSPLKPAVDQAIADGADVDSVLVVKRTGGDVEWVEGRDVWWHDVVDTASTTHKAEFF
ncbi:MAG: AMP-binding protein, partial [Microbacteriaceae bacterium]